MSSAEGAQRRPPRIEHVVWSDPRAVALRTAMDAETGAMYAGFATGLSDPQRAALDDALTVDPAAITHTVIALDEEVPIGHAALRPFGSSVEVKKVFVAESARGRAVARQLMRELELIAAAQGAASLVLQTGPLQVAAIGLYVDLGYIKVPPFGKYTAISNALCYEKIL